MDEVDESSYMIDCEIETNLNPLGKKTLLEVMIQSLDSQAGLDVYHQQLCGQIWKQNLPPKSDNFHITVMIELGAFPCYP
jgi:hypothetical protein